MSIYVFLGPSLSHARAREILDATYLPPVQQGDIIRLLAKKPRVIGIVDGFFGAVPAVWHKEILLAMDEGCHVFGASSMGALRAAELHPFGMRGVGRIYELYRDGVLEDDDEVAVSHASSDYGFQSLSVAMVNIRDLLDAAERARVLDKSEVEALTAHAKALFYRERSLPGLLQAAKQLGISEAKYGRFAEFVRGFGPMSKERDAVTLLETVREFMANEPPPMRTAKRVERTIFLHELRSEVNRQRPPRRTFTDDSSVANTGLALWALRKEALMQILARAVRKQLGIEVSRTEIENAWQELRRRSGFTDPEREAAWLSEHGSSLEEAYSTLGDIVGLQKLEAYFTRMVDAELPNLVAVLAALHGGDE